LSLTFIEKLEDFKDYITNRLIKYSPKISLLNDGVLKRAQLV